MPRRLESRWLVGLGGIGGSSWVPIMVGRLGVVWRGVRLRKRRDWDYEIKDLLGLDIGLQARHLLGIRAARFLGIGLGTSLLFQVESEWAATISAIPQCMV
jgi:hypothetical protein